MGRPVERPGRVPGKGGGAVDQCGGRELGAFEFSVGKDMVELATTLCMRKKKSYRTLARANGWM